MNLPDFDFDDTPEPVKRVIEAENFETAFPATLKSRTPEPEPIEFPQQNINTIIGRALPNSLEAEEGLLGTIFAGFQCGEPVFDRAVAAGITTNSFYDPNHGIIFHAIHRMNSEGSPIDVTTISEHLKATRKLEQIGGYPTLLRVSSETSMPTQASFFIRRVRDLTILRELIRSATGVVNDCYAVDTDVQDFVVEVQDRIRRVLDAATPTTKSADLRALTDFTIALPGDYSILLGNRYLNRGDGAVLASTSGMGKSSMTLQMAIMFALGSAAFGIHPNGPMRSLIIQSEDSDGDIAEVWASIVHVMKLTPEEIADVKDRVKVVSDRVNRGSRFVANLRKLISAHNPDLVWINPLQAFIDGDVTDSQDLGKFLREDLNRLNSPPKFAYILVHHTTKPASGKDRHERLWHEVMYDMAGGAEIINWARAIISLRPGDNEGEFNLVLAKRGRRAGVRKQVDHEGVKYWESTTTIPLKHSEGRFDVPGIEGGLPTIFWVERAPDAPKEGKSNRSGRTAIYDFSDYSNIFPDHKSEGLELAPLERLLSSNKVINKKSLYSALKRWESEGFVDVICQSGTPMRYRKARP